ncbi:thiamine phosphate synthase [Paenibacillus sediminis]|uniref:Thiamine-phosphate synthase n=1 Tax=Paenibacillus sediminis TaxID=664909 RepID=A0ABS4H2P4_9BACL|nr:thiamine phosphate synthase [Paenibacillus sediminis]MBP1936804.1 thiamine-phosphate pyrophosphorylase [Paenibacillus sediminis]
MTRISSEEMRNLLKLYFIMGSVNCKIDPLQVIREAIKGGITLFQFREKGNGALLGEEKYAFAKQVQSVCRQHGIPFIVNDDIDLALSLDADGVHIGQDDESAEVVRQRIGNKILGVSAHTLEEAKLAVSQGADYLGLGPVFPTTSKEDAKAVQGTSLIRLLRDQGMDIPIVGIGGITAHNAKSVVDAGADGVSVISAISLADHVQEAARELKEAVIGYEW